MRRSQTLETFQASLTEPNLGVYNKFHAQKGRRRRRGLACLCETAPIFRGPASPSRSAIPTFRGGRGLGGLRRGSGGAPPGRRSGRRGATATDIGAWTTSFLPKKGVAEGGGWTTWEDRQGPARREAPQAGVRRAARNPDSGDGGEYLRAGQSRQVRRGDDFKKRLIVATGAAPAPDVLWPHAQAPSVLKFYAEARSAH